MPSSCVTAVHQLILLEATINDAEYAHEGPPAFYRVSASAKLHYTDTVYGHVVQHHQRTTSLQFYIAMPEPNISTCQDVGMWQIFVRWWQICCTTSCRIVVSSSVGVLYNMSVAGVRVVEFGTK